MCPSYSKTITAITIGSRFILWGTKQFKGSSSIPSTGPLIYFGQPWSHLDPCSRLVKRSPVCNWFQIILILADNDGLNACCLDAPWDSICSTEPPRSQDHSGPCWFYFWPFYLCLDEKSNLSFALVLAWYRHCRLSVWDSWLLALHSDCDCLHCYWDHASVYSKAAFGPDWFRFVRTWHFDWMFSGRGFNLNLLLAVDSWSPSTFALSSLEGCHW